MTTLIGFVLIIAIFIGAVIHFRFGSISSAVYYLRHNRGPLKGILIFVGGFILLSIAVLGVRHATASDFKYFQYAEAFAGVEWPIGSPSHQCARKGPDNKTVSNGGVRVNGFIWRGFLHGNLKYQHNSCAFNEDWDVRDFVGGELVIPIFDRRK